jgi:hypothetical protein
LLYLEFQAFLSKYPSLPETSAIQGKTSDFETDKEKLFDIKIQDSDFSPITGLVNLGEHETMLKLVYQIDFPIVTSIQKWQYRDKKFRVREVSEYLRLLSSNSIYPMEILLIFAKCLWTLETLNAPQIREKRR